MDCSTSGLPVHHQLLELTQTHVHWFRDAIQPSHPLLSPFSPALNLSQHQVFSNESVPCIRQPKYLSFSFSISSSNEYLGLISFRIYRFDLLSAQWTLKSLLQYHSSKAVISYLVCACFIHAETSPIKVYRIQGSLDISGTKTSRTLSPLLSFVSPSFYVCVMIF